MRYDHIIIILSNISIFFYFLYLFDYLTHWFQLIDSPIQPTCAGGLGICDDRVTNSLPSPSQAQATFPFPNPDRSPKNQTRFVSRNHNWSCIATLATDLSSWRRRRRRRGRNRWQGSLAAAAAAPSARVPICLPSARRALITGYPFFLVLVWSSMFFI